MPLNKINQRSFHRRLYGGHGMLKTITLLKRGDDQKQGTVTAYTINYCRRSSIHKTGETIQGEASSDFRTVWHIFREQLDKIGIRYINNLDRIVEAPDYGDPNQLTRYWQPEATVDLSSMLFELCLDISCLSVDPPVVS